jgi:nickel superoxide dismutase
VGLFRPTRVAHAHCDLFCGVYDPAQAMIEAKSVLNCCTKYHASDDDVFRARCISIKEERAELVKHHLNVLWADFFKPPHLEQFPNLHDLFWRATNAAGDAKKSMDPAVSEGLISLIQEISDIFWQTEASKAAGVYPPS